MSEPDRGAATPATRLLTAQGIPFTTHLYPYELHGGAPHAAACLDVPTLAVAKTLVMRTDDGRRLLVLMHGDRQVSTRQLARELGARKVLPCSPEEALKVTGYEVGGISPFGTRTALPLFVEDSIFELDAIYVNGGRRGLLVRIAPAALALASNCTRVRVAAD